MKPNAGAFKKGEKRPGQGKRGPGKFTRTVKEAVQAAFDEIQGDKNANLVTWAKQNPGEFYKLAGKLIPAAVDATLTGSVEFTSIERRVVDPKP